MLFMKLLVPRMRPSNSIDAGGEIDQESLFEELHSMVGTLEQDVLHVETRYKHSLIHESNTVTCRVACKLHRPKTDSRWSTYSKSDERSNPSHVHERLAKYIISECPPEQALDLIRYHLGPVASTEPTIEQICVGLENQLRDQRSASYETAVDKPSILISDTSLEQDSSIASPTPSEKFSTAPCSPTSGAAPSSGSLLSATPAKVAKRKTSTATSSTHPLISAAKVTTAVSGPYTDASSADTGNGSDDARALWKHIRQSSLSTLQQLVESKPETIAELEANDDVVKELRRKALANKRSVGAETLRAWRWDEKRGQGGVAPWM